MKLTENKLRNLIRQVLLQEKRATWRDRRELEKYTKDTEASDEKSDKEIDIDDDAAATAPHRPSTQLPRAQSEEELDPIAMGDKKRKSLEQMRNLVYQFADEEGGDDYEYHVKDDKWQVELLGTKKTDLKGKMFDLHKNPKYKSTIDKLDKKYWFARSYDAPGRSKKVPDVVYKTALNTEDELSFRDATPDLG